MSTRKLILDFSTLKDAELSPKAEHIVTSMTDNAAFPTPTPTLATVQTGINTYNTALARAINRGTKVDTLQKDQARKALETLLVHLGNYVTEVADGNAIMLASSGFDLSKIRQKIGALPKPENFKLTPGNNKGSMEVSVKKVMHADFYEFQFAELTNDDAAWQTRTTQKRKMTIDGLTSGKQYKFRVAAAGSDPTRNWSEEMISYIL